MVKIYIYEMVKIYIYEMVKIYNQIITNLVE